MNMSDDIRRTLTDPKPLYALAGAADLAAEKLKDAPDRFTDAPARLAEAGVALSALANRLAADAPEHLAKVGATVQDTVGKAARPDTSALRERAQMAAIQQVGRLLEAAGKAVETYDELAERGRGVVGRYTGGEGASGDADPGVTVVVEQLDDETEFLAGGEHASATLPEDEVAGFAPAPDPFGDPDVDFIAEAETGPVADEPAGAGFAAGFAEPPADPSAPKKAARKRAAAPRTPRPDQDDAQ
jgi:hypothetical protein